MKNTKKKACIIICILCVAVVFSACHAQKETPIQQEDVLTEQAVIDQPAIQEETPFFPFEPDAQETESSVMSESQAADSPEENDTTQPHQESTCPTEGEMHPAATEGVLDTEEQDQDSVQYGDFY